MELAWAITPIGQASNAAGQLWQFRIGAHIYRVRLDAADVTLNTLYTKVFNPIRPMDDGVQADADSDGRGDACDKCPLDAGAVCTAAAGFKLSPKNVWFRNSASKRVYG